MGFGAFFGTALVPRGAAAAGCHCKLGYKQSKIKQNRKGIWMFVVKVLQDCSPGATGSSGKERGAVLDSS